MKRMPQIQFMTSNNYGRLLMLVHVLLLSFSCNSDDDTVTQENLTGEWLLIEVLSDPGDGSGQFRTVESDKRISITDNGTYSSNGDICSFSTLSGDPSEGSYQEDDNGFFVDCDSPFPSPVRLNIDNGNLILTFTCIEPCQQKFRRLN